MEAFEIIIIGGGAAGLMAARELSKRGKRVAVLEARDRLGGRIHTLDDAGFTSTAEAGAEFIHGDLPMTIDLLKEAKLAYQPIGGNIYRFSKGMFIKEQGFMEDAEPLIKRLQALDEDMSVASFLNTFFPEERYADLKASVTGYTEGYDAADTQRASAFALRDEWSGEEEGDQYRVKGGYGKLVSFLEEQCIAAGCSFHFSAVVKQVNWREGYVEVKTDTGTRYTSQKAIIAVPLGVLQAGPDKVAKISFLPVLDGKEQGLQVLGFGNVIKILLQFDEAFWGTGARAGAGNTLDDPGWIFSDAVIPTWWTQAPEPSALLTGWLAGPGAAKCKDDDDDGLLEKAIDALSIIFRVDRQFIREKLVASRVINWTADPFTLGAYAYSTIGGKEAIQAMLRPVENTLFFAGEAFHDGPQMGTVEGALQSGSAVARRLLDGDVPLRKN